MIDVNHFGESVFNFSNNHLRVIVKKNLAVKICLGTNGQLLANNQPAVSQQSVNSLPTDNQQFSLHLLAVS